MPSHRQDDPLKHATGDWNRVLLCAFAEESLVDRDRENMVAHLAVCGECRELLLLLTPEEGPPTSVARSGRRRVPGNGS